MTITVRSGICISTMQPVSLQKSLRRQPTMRPQSLPTEREQSSTGARTWEYNNIADVGDENLGILPIYIGVEGEENQGVCTGTENYWCVNSKASEEDIQATLDFLELVRNL